MTSNALYLGDLSRFCTEQTLAELFNEYGYVLEVKVSRTSMNISLGYGFVKMGCHSQAEEAMEKLRGKSVSGRPLRIDWAARNIKDTNSYDSNNDMINSIHVRFESHQRMNLFTEESLTTFFEPYDKIVDVSIKNSTFDSRTGNQKGYGFVHFEKSSEGAQAAILAILTETGDEFVTLVCEASKNFLKYHPSVVLPGGGGSGKEKGAPKERRMSGNFEHKKKASRSLSFHDAPVPAHRDMTLPKRPPSRSGSFSVPDRDNSDENYPRVRRQGSSFCQGASFPKQEPFHPQYMQESSNYNKEFNIMPNSEDMYYTLQNPENMQGGLSNEAYIPVQNHYQNPYYDPRFRQHSMAPVPPMKEGGEIDPASSPHGPVPMPVTPPGMQEYQYPPNFNMLPAPQRRLSQMSDFGDPQRRLSQMSDFGEPQRRLSHVSDFGEEVYSPNSTYPPVDYAQSSPSYPDTYSDSNQPQYPVQYIYPGSNNGYNSYQGSFGYNEIEGGYEQPYEYTLPKLEVAPIST
eukprot:CAMPEP_0119037192 /NCGR_PEP_ID=MMETSP1177-20130426/5398_1 /TAXON_ID=2985 /ORGANISM="Ochromonas sp, Strain CCMP1899" /LENGTH=514 /DNA_ID=CAMNT_0006998115 /DNA_START=120 /DNA_END=1664 /DNA_ORIENTATION=+